MCERDGVEVADGLKLYKLSGWLANRLAKSKEVLLQGG